jgi:hypothetical protein
VQLMFVVFVRTDLFVEQNRRTKTQYVGPLTFLIYNAKISDNNAESGEVPRMLAAFTR